MNKALYEIWATSARRWRESAADWRRLVDRADDVNLRLFAAAQATQAERWAEEDGARAMEFAS